MRTHRPRNHLAATGKPLCDLCKGHWIVCSVCGDAGLAAAGTLKAPLCARCVNPDPDFWKRCRICNTTWQLTTASCTRCSLDARLHKVFATDEGTIAPELDRLRERLDQVDRPIYAITWLRKTNVQSTITALVHEKPTITHAALDAMPPSKTLDHFRSMLTSVGALKFRDEGLMRLEREVKESLDGYAPGEHPRALRGFILWHLMRRLRGRLKDKPASIQQIQNVREPTLPALAGGPRQDAERMHADGRRELPQRHARASETVFRLRPVGRAPEIRAIRHQGPSDALDRSGRSARPG